MKTERQCMGDARYVDSTNLECTNTRVRTLEVLEMAPAVRCM